MIVKQYLAIIFFLLEAVDTAAGTFTGRLVKVLDGDTVEVLHRGRAERIRLHGIDAPERGQPFSRKARQYVLEIAAGKTVTVHESDRDRYGRTVAEVVLPDGRSLNRELVRQGYAWWYRKYSDDATLGVLEAEARRKRRGLWSIPDPVPPWQWRSGQREVPDEPVSSGAETPNTWKCGTKRFCKEMTSCAEARFHFTECGLDRLDGDGDGIPCEALCQ